MNSSKVGALPLCVKGMFSILNVSFHYNIFIKNSSYTGVYIVDDEYCLLLLLLPKFQSQELTGGPYYPVF